MKKTELKKLIKVVLKEHELGWGVSQTLQLDFQEVIKRINSIDDNVIKYQNNDKVKHIDTAIQEARMAYFTCQDLLKKLTKIKRDHVDFETRANKHKTVSGGIRK